MNRELWESWALKRAAEMSEEPWMLCKWETVAGVVWPREKAELMIGDVREKLGLGPGQVLLDVGCGPGWIGQGLLPAVREVIGLDFSAGMLKIAAGFTDLALVQGDARALPFRDECLDRVLIYFTLINFPDRGEVLAALLEALRVLKPGGRVLAGQMPLASQSHVYDREKKRYLEYCASRFDLGPDLSRDHGPPVVLFEDSYAKILENELGVRLEVHQSFNHFWRKGETIHCPWRVDYILFKNRTET